VQQARASAKPKATQGAQTPSTRSLAAAANSKPQSDTVQQARATAKTTPRGGPGAKIQKEGSLSTYNKNKDKPKIDKTKKDKPKKDKIKVQKPKPKEEKEEGDVDEPTPPQPPTPDPPFTIMPVDPTPETPAIKSAPIETVLFNDEKVSDNLLLDLLFEDVGGQELLTMSRHDTVNGQPVAYQPFKNLGILQNTFNPSNLLRLQETSDKFFANFVINLNSKIPKVGNGLNGSNYYLTSSGDLVIEFVNLKSDEEIEIQIVTDGTIDEVGI
jgi:hypothetical protein